MLSSLVSTYHDTYHEVFTFSLHTLSFLFRSVLFRLARCIDAFTSGLFIGMFRCFSGDDAGEVYGTDTENKGVCFVYDYWIGYIF